MEQELEEQRSFKWKISFGFALLLAVVWAVLSQFMTIGTSNVSSYLIGVVLFIVSFFILYRFLPSNIFRVQSRELTDKAYRLACIGMFVVFVAVLLFAFLQASVISGGQAAMEWGFNGYFIAVFLAGSALLIALFVLQRNNKLRISRKLLNALWWISAAGILLFVAWWAYIPNSLNYMWDYEAYWFSAFSAARHIPLTADTTSYYGHYGLLMAPFFYLLGGFSPVRVGLLLSLESVVMTLVLCYILYQVCNSFLWRFLGLFALLNYFCTLSTVEGQMTPHRVLFPVFLVGLAVFFLKNKERNTKKFHVICLVLGYGLAALGLVWSTDSGMVGILAWCALHFYVLFTSHRLCMKDILHCVKIISCGILCFIFAWQLTSVLNTAVWKGEPISFELFITPFSAQAFSVGTAAPSESETSATSTVAVSGTGQAEISSVPNTVSSAASSSVPSSASSKDNAIDEPNPDAGYIMGLQLELVRAWTPWGAMLVLFFSFLAKGLSNTCFFNAKPKYDWKNGFAFFTAVLGIFMLIYFFNRVYYYNFFTVYFFVVLLLASAGEMATHGSKQQGGKHHFRKAFYNTGAVCLALCLLVTISFSAGRLPIQVRKIAACQKADTMSVFFQELADRVADEENFRFVGSSATYCNAALNRTNDEIMWHPWVNELHIPQFPADATLIITDEGYWQMLQKVDFFSSLVDNVYYLDDTFTLNYNNVGYEESKQFFVYKPVSSQ